MLRARRTRDSPERATASSRCDLQRFLEKRRIASPKSGPAPEATTEDKKAAAATQKLASNAPVTESDLDALLPDEGYETLSKPEKKNAAVTDADLASILPDEGYETLPPPKQNAQPEG